MGVNLPDAKFSTIHAGVQAISICGWSKICSDVYGCCGVHVVVSINENYKSLLRRCWFSGLKINTNHVAPNINPKTGSWRNATILVLQDLHVRHNKENTPIYMYYVVVVVTVVVMTVVGASGGVIMIVVVVTVTATTTMRMVMVSLT